MERIENDGKIEERCFRCETDHMRQLGENNILQVIIHSPHNVRTYKETTQTLVPEAS